MAHRPERKVLHRVSNPPDPWQATTVEWVGEPPATRAEVYRDQTRSILSKNDSPDIPFTYSVNPYRGCGHGCAYCYARPTHPYLGFGAGTDFESKLVVKPAAPQLLKAAFERPGWQGEIIAFSGNTDCYQPLEASFHLTRACLEVCRDYRNPVSIITKSALIERDLELLVQLMRETHVEVRVSVPFFDPDVARAIEPYAPSPERRLKTIARLSEAGIPVGVNLAPIIPGLNDQDGPKILEAAHRAGARFFGSIMLRLPSVVEPVFEERLRALLPLRAERVMQQIADCRGGQRNDGTFGARMRGQGPRWEAIAQLVEQAGKRLGFGPSPSIPEPSPFRRPRPPRVQGELFAQVPDGR